MDSATFNGIPLTTYGLIGATTMLLAYSVFRDDSIKTPEQGSAAMSGFFTSPLASKPKETVTEQTKEVEAEMKEMEAETKEVEVEKKEPEKSITDKDESPPTKAVGGKRKRTKRRRHKNKRTRNNHK